MGPNMVAFDLCPEVRRGDFLEEPGVEVAGVVHQDVDPAEPVHGCLDGGGRVGGVGDVELDREEVLVVADGLGELFGVAAGGDHGVAGWRGLPSRCRCPCRGRRR